MKYCSITPNRAGERESLLNFCVQQLLAMRMQNTYIMNEPAKSDKPDLVWRVRNGIELAKKDGMDWVFIIESDDLYKSFHIDAYLPFMGSYDFIGDAFSTYYNIATRRWEKIHHHGRASLFTTAFRIEALRNFKWPPDDKIFLDIDLWKYAKQHRLRCKFIDSGAIGIKGHGEGKTGGKGHKMKLKNDDADLRFLNSKMQPHHKEFYTKLMRSL